MGYETDFIEVELADEPAYAAGDRVLIFDGQRQRPASVLHTFKKKVVLAPADSELLQIGASSESTMNELLNDEHQTVKSYKLNTFGTITDDFKTRAVRLCDVSRLGIGFEVDDFSVRLNQIYESTFYCDDEAIRMRLVVRYAHIMEKTIRYGSDIYYMSTGDLYKFRYFVAMQNFKQLMLA
jgi:hypothetical protein